MSGSRRVRAVTGVTLGLALSLAAACVDSPTAAMTPDALASDDPLAQTFDALAATAATNGDLARKEGFEMAALAVRSGVAPSQLELSIGNPGSERMDAFVTAVEYSSALAATLRPPARRSVVAWRRNANGALRVVSAHTPTDSSAVVSPLSLGGAMSTVAVYAGASAQYLVLAPTAASSSATSSSWYATEGVVKVRQIGTTGGCARLEQNAGIRGVVCQGGEFRVLFDTKMQQMAGRPLRAISASGLAVRSIGEQTIVGEHFTFSCIAPSSTRGCQ